MRHRVAPLIVLVSLCLMFYSVHAGLVGQNKEQVARGKKLYLSYCASCNGVDASGNGAVASSLKQQPPDLRRLLSSRSHKQRVAAAGCLKRDAGETVTARFANRRRRADSDDRRRDRDT